MSEQRISQRSSDFSIARILSSNISSNQKKQFKVNQDFSINEDEFTEEKNQECRKNVKQVLRIRMDREKFIKPESVNTNSKDVDGFKEDEDKRFGILERKLPWLQCTRYSPPKLPRRSTAVKQRKRKLGSHPRIPFTKFQIQVLEEKYKINAYLSRRDVIQLGGILNLPQNRVKIWFQNRRARERKESQSNNLSINP